MSTEEDQGLRTDVNNYLASTVKKQVIALYTSPDRSNGIEYYECEVARDKCSGEPLLNIPYLPQVVQLLYI